MTHTILTGDSAQTLKTLPNDHFDSIVTDPPYGIEFLGKEWDSNTGAIEIWQECFRVLKPGGHLLAFSAARTYHHLATNIESVGFEIRDQLMWIYSSGFPKAQDVGRSIERRKGNTPSHFEYRKQKDNTRSVESHSNGTSPYCSICKRYTVTRCDQCPPEPKNEWSGWKTALKPAHEPIVMARKPFKGSTTDNVLRHGVGALNIDASRIPYADESDIGEYLNNKRGPMERGTGVEGEQIGMFDTGTGFKQIKRKVTAEEDLPAQGRFPSNVVGEISDYQKYFYCPKVSRRERHCGFDPNSKGANIDANTHGKTPYCDDCLKTFNGSNDHSQCDPAKKTFKEKRNQSAPDGNNHPTVKPVALMRYLIRLVTPPNGKVLDPFCGSGSTGMAARELGHEFVGSEQNPEYVVIANRRIRGWIQQNTPPHTPFDSLFE